MVKTRSRISRTQTKQGQWLLDACTILAAACGLWIKLNTVLISASRLLATIRWALAKDLKTLNERARFAHRFYDYKIAYFIANSNKHIYNKIYEDASLK